MVDVILSKVKGTKKQDIIFGIKYYVLLCVPLTFDNMTSTIFEKIYLNET